MTSAKFIDNGDKRHDSRYEWWYTTGRGHECYELDAMDPRVLRRRVENAITSYLDIEAWNRCQKVEEAERQSMDAFLTQWKEMGLK